MRAAALQICGAAVITLSACLAWGLDQGLAVGGALLLGFGIWDELSS